MLARSRSLLVICSLLSALVVVAAAHAASTTVKQTKLVGVYKLRLQIGPAEDMSKSERMMSGMKATCTLGGMPMSNVAVIDDAKQTTCNRHIELHVFGRTSGRILANVHVTLKLVNTATHTSIKVAVAMMEAMQNLSDFHYGNNIYAPAGKYTVRATVNRTSATFTVQLR